MGRTPNTQKYSAVVWEMHRAADGMASPIGSQGFTLVGEANKETGP